MDQRIKIALIKGDGIGVDVAEAAQAVVDNALLSVGGPKLEYSEIRAGARYYTQTGNDIQPGGEDAAGELAATKRLADYCRTQVQAVLREAEKFEMSQQKAGKSSS